MPCIAKRPLPPPNRIGMLVIPFTISTGTGDKDIVDSSYPIPSGWMLGAALIAQDKMTSTDTYTNSNFFGGNGDPSFCYGLTDGTTSGCHYESLGDRHTTADEHPGGSSDNSILRFCSAGSGGAMTAVATFSTWLDGGLRINVSDAVDVAGCQGFALVWYKVGGIGSTTCDYANVAPNTSQNGTVNASASQANDFCFWSFGHGSDTEGVGVNHHSGTSMSQDTFGSVGYNCFEQENDPPGNAVTAFNAGNIATRNGGTFARFKISANTSTYTQIQTLDGGTQSDKRIKGLIFGGSSNNTNTAWNSTPTATGNWSYSGAGWEPNWGVWYPTGMLTSRSLNVNVENANDVSTIVCIGATGTNGVSRCLNIGLRYNVSPFEVWAKITTGPVYDRGRLVGDEYEATLVSWDTNGYTLNFSNTDSTDAHRLGHFISTYT